MVAQADIAIGDEGLLIKYHGDFNGIRLGTMVDSQKPFLALLEAIANQIAPEINLEVRIKNTKTGSFELYTVLSTATVGLLQTRPEAIKQIFDIAKDCFALVKFAAGNTLSIKRKTPDGVHVELINEGDAEVTVGIQSLQVIGNNNNIVVNVNRIAKALQCDPDIESFSAELTDSKQTEPLMIRREDFNKLSRRPRLPEAPEHSETREAILYLRKVDVFPEDHTKWDFFYEGQSITNVKVEDSDFLERVRNEVLRFGAGDRIKCTLRVFYKQETGVPYPVVKGYQVEEVIEFMPAKNDSGFNFGDS